MVWRDSTGTRPLMVVFPMLFIITILDAFVFYDLVYKEKWFISPLMVVFYNFIMLFIIGLFVYLHIFRNPKKVTPGSEREIISNFQRVKEE